MALGLLASLYSNCFAFLSQKKERKERREGGREGKERKRKERKIEKKEREVKKKKLKNPNPNPNPTEPNHQLQYTKYTFTKGGKRGFPVYFLGDLVIQANVATPPQNPKEQHIDEPNVMKGASTFWVERDTIAIWRNAARYCWFKVNLFIPELYANLQQSRQRRISMKRERLNHCTGNFFLNSSDFFLFVMQVPNLNFDC